MKVPLENTYVVYNEGDHLGHLLAYITLTPVYIMVMYTTLVLCRRDVSTAFTLLGQMINLVINKILKKCIDQPRPAAYLNISDSGMPSNHSQFISYFAVYYSIQFLFNSPKLHISYKLLYASGLLFLLLLVCYSRWYLNYHTIEQILVGIIVGSLFGSIWSIIDIYYGQIIGNVLMSIPLIQLFEFKNYSPLDEYLNLRNKSTANNKSKLK